MADGFRWQRHKPRQAAQAARRAPNPARRALWYRHTPHAATLGEGRGRFHALDLPHRWWPLWEAEGMARFMAWEHEVGERVAAALRLPTGWYG